MPLDAVSLTLFFLFLSLFIPGAAFPETDSDPAGLVLDSSEKFFISLKENDFKFAWNLLSSESHETIITDVLNASRKTGIEISREEIIRDFSNSGIISGNYWKSFLDTFNPDMVLRESRWEMGLVKKQSAEIIITHKKSENPVVLKMSKENGEWKVGLVETFWTGRSDSFLRRLMDFLAG
ncbi:MAG: hypothetical protein C4526_05795 [Nitrospiraceae bacterium]|nr:MAG: hypothetical protein C4526_05795 [Nitrospiraceae bacterium]